MGNEFLKPKQSFSQWDINFDLQIVLLPLKNRMFDFLHRNHNTTGCHIYVLISCRFVSYLMAIWCALFNKNLKRIHTVNKFLAATNMTWWGNHCTLPMTLLALLLELLNKPWRYLLFMQSKSLTVTLCACFHIRWVICTGSSTVRTDNFSSISDLMFFAWVKLLQSQSNL